MTVGILSFGSLVTESGAELARHIVRRIDGMTTPFAVEFARSSRTRDGGPTLVPVPHGGAPVPASLLVLDDGVDVQRARELVYLRESRREADPGDRAHAVGWIKQAERIGDADECVYVALPANIDPLTPQRLADLAVASAAAGAGAARRDGISYLREQKERGVRTPLMPSYEAEILTRTGADTLGHAWARARRA